MLLQPVADLLIAQVTDFRKVAGAANFAAAREDLKATPTGYVLSLSDVAKPNTYINKSVQQHVIERFGVILAVDNKRDVRGDAVNGPLESLRSQVILALLGFQPAAGYDPVLYGGGRLLELDVTTLWWQLEFTTGYYERKV
jgi:hypothetical protein